MFTIAIVNYPGAQSASVLGLVDLLTVASRLHLERRAQAPAVEIVTVTSPEMLRKPDTAFSALILPPSAGPNIPIASSELVDWLVERHREGTILCSVCVGAFILAETTLLDGRTVTTHWAAFEQFSSRFPRVHLDIDKLLIDDGDVMTAGGLMAWVDLGLHLIARFLGPTTMLATARYFLVDPGGREQRFYNTFTPVFTHADPSIRGVQRWLQTQICESITIAAMSAKAGLGERTFLRRFVRATGLKPSEYLQQLRVAKARELLESSSDSLDQIASAVGYTDTGAFRKIFQRILGLPPGEYRRRFAPPARSRRS